MGAESRCTHAHLLFPYIATPLFVRENQFDTAKLANCGLDVHRHLGEQERRFLTEWGRRVRKDMRAIGARPRNGAWAPSCLAHAGNLGFASSPRLTAPAKYGKTGAELTLREVFHAWYFGEAVASSPTALLRTIVADCGELPCSNATGAGQTCPRLVERECGAACERARRERRIREGKNPDGPGHNVCNVPLAGDGATARNTAPHSRLAHLLKPLRRASEVTARHCGSLRFDPALEAVVEQLV